MNTANEFNVIYAKYYSNILRNLLCKGANYYTAEEIANDTFLKAQKNWSKFDESKASVKTWLNEISYNLFIDSHRANKAKIQTEVSIDETTDVEGHEIYASKVDIKSFMAVQKTDYKLENEQMWAKVKLVIANMNKTQQQIAELFLIKDMAQTEIAEIMNIPINSVKGNLTRIREIMAMNFQAEKNEYGFR